MMELHDIDTIDDSDMRGIIKSWGFTRYDLEIELHARNVIDANLSSLDIVSLAKKQGLITNSKIMAVSTGIHSILYNETPIDKLSQSEILTLFPELKGSIDYLFTIINGESFIYGIDRFSCHSDMNNRDILEYCNDNNCIILDIDSLPHIVVPEHKIINSIKAEVSSPDSANPIAIWLANEDFDCYLHVALPEEIKELRENSNLVVEVDTKMPVIQNLPANMLPMQELITEMMEANHHSAAINFKDIQSPYITVNVSVEGEESVEINDPIKMRLAFRSLLSKMGQSFHDLCTTPLRCSLNFTDDYGNALDSQVSIIINTFPLHNGVIASLNIIRSDELDDAPDWDEDLNLKCTRYLNDSGLLLSLSPREAEIDKLVGFGNNNGQLEGSIALLDNYPGFINGIDPFTIDVSTAQEIKNQIKNYINCGIKTLVCGELYSAKVTLLAVYGALYGLRVLASIHSTHSSTVVTTLRLMLLELENTPLSNEQIESVMTIIDLKTTH